MSDCIEESRGLYLINILHIRVIVKSSNLLLWNCTLLKWSKDCVEENEKAGCQSLELSYTIVFVQWGEIREHLH